jgi:hypothetical protein
MRFFDEMTTVPQSSCSVIKHARAVLLVHVCVFVMFALGAQFAFSSMSEADEFDGACEEPLFNFSLPAKVGFAFCWGVMMNVVTPVA